MRQLKEVYPGYAEDVALYAVGVDPFEGLPELERLRENMDLPFPIAWPVGRMLIDFRVVHQSTKVALDASGVIVYRDGFALGGPEKWKAVFQQLAAGAPR